MEHPCHACGACCASFRVAFHWSEAEPSLGGQTPVALTEQLDPHRLVMRGTQSPAPRCVALQGIVGNATHCTIYAQRPSPCSAMRPAFEDGEPSPQCDRARIAHGLQALTAADWKDMAAVSAISE